MLNILPGVWEIQVANLYQEHRINPSCCRLLHGGFRTEFRWFLSETFLEWEFRFRCYISASKEYFNFSWLSETSANNLKRLASLFKLFDNFSLPNCLLTVWPVERKRWNYNKDNFQRQWWFTPSLPGLTGNQIVSCHQHAKSSGCKARVLEFVHLKSKLCSSRNVILNSSFLILSLGKNSIQTEMFQRTKMKCHLLYLLKPYIVRMYYRQYNPLDRESFCTSRILPWNIVYCLL